MTEEKTFSGIFSLKNVPEQKIIFQDSFYKGDFFMFNTRIYQFRGPRSPAPFSISTSQPVYIRVTVPIPLEKIAMIMTRDDNAEDFIVPHDDDMKGVNWVLEKLVDPTDAALDELAAAYQGLGKYGQKQPEEE